MDVPVARIRTEKPANGGCVETGSGRLIFETPRLAIHLATVADAPLVHSLWADERVMRNVGFPSGLPVSLEDVRTDIQGRAEDEFSQLLIVHLKPSGEAIGQCSMSLPDEQGIAETDVKLLPTYWGRRFGVEIKRGLVDYLFIHSDCEAVQGTPNISNPASIKMQESVGGVRVNEGIYEFPESMRSFTTPVHYVTYRVYRQAWQQSRVKIESNS